MTLFWMRRDLTRDQIMTRWCGPYAQLAGRLRGALEYRQHDLEPALGDLWPAADGLATDMPIEHPVDGMAETTFTGPAAALRALAHSRRPATAQHDLFARTALYLSAPGGGRWFTSGPGHPVGARIVALLRARPGIGRAVFRDWLDELLAPLLAATPGVDEVRSMAFLPWSAAWCRSSDVAPVDPAERHLHGVLVLDGGDDDALRHALRAPALRALAPEQAQLLAAVGVYRVTDTRVFRSDNRPTLPQTGPVRKPALAPLRRLVPPAPPRSRRTTSSTPFPPSTHLALDGTAPEDVVVDGDGTLLCGVAGGRILRLDPDTGRQVTVTDTGGRPLGLDVAPDGRLIICDAHRGLLGLEPGTGRLETLVQYVGGLPLRFCSNASVAGDGTIWFTESTTRFDQEHSFGAVLEQRPSGRLLRRDPDGKVQVILDRLFFPNGITLTPDESAVLFVETIACRVSRMPVTGPDAGSPTVVADNLPGHPDNLSRFVEGRAWLALPSPRNRILDRSAALPGWIRKAVWAIPTPLQPRGEATTWFMALDEHGRVLADLQTDSEDFDMVTGVAERVGDVYCASLQRGSLLRVHGAASATEP